MPEVLVLGLHPYYQYATRILNNAGIYTTFLPKDNKDVARWAISVCVRYAIEKSTPMIVIMTDIDVEELVNNPVPTLGYYTNWELCVVYREFPSKTRFLSKDLVDVTEEIVPRLKQIFDYE